MLSTALIVFREMLEISLILGVVVAATMGLPRRARWIIAGLLCGISGSVIVAIFANTISSSFSGTGQELFNAAILFIAVVVLAWTIVWMKRRGREMMAEMREVSIAVKEGRAPFYSLTLVIALSVLRDGSEIVLFVYGIVVANQETLFNIISGFIIGTCVGIIVGFALYAGIIRASTRYIFSVTSWMLALLAAGMASQAAGYLVAANVLPTIIDTVWDSSAIISSGSIFGKALESLIGYNDRPSLIQLIFYGVTLCGIGSFLLFSHKLGPAPKLNNNPAV